MFDARNAHLLRATVSLLRLPCRYSFPNGLADLYQALKRPWVGRDENFLPIKTGFQTLSRVLIEHYRDLLFCVSQLSMKSHNRHYEVFHLRRYCYTRKNGALPFGQQEPHSCSLT